MNYYYYYYTTFNMRMKGNWDFRTYHLVKIPDVTHILPLW